MSAEFPSPQNHEGSEHRAFNGFVQLSSSNSPQIYHPGVSQRYSHARSKVLYITLPKKTFFFEFYKFFYKDCWGEKKDYFSFHVSCYLVKKRQRQFKMKNYNLKVHNLRDILISFLDIKCASEPTVLLIFFP